MRVGVKFCGGCNPRYDRVALYETLRHSHPETSYELAQPGVEYDELLVLCGCMARCADLDGLIGRIVRYICDPTEA